MESYTPDELVRRVRFKTNHLVTGSQVDSVATSDIIAEMDIGYLQMRRELIAAVPTMFLTSSVVAVSAGTEYVSKPADLERLFLFERQVPGSPTRWAEVPLAPPGSTSAFALTVREVGDAYVLDPPERTAGTYRVWYQTKPLKVSGSYSSYEIPGELEECMVQLGCAAARMACDEDPSQHLALYRKVLDESKGTLRQRYGRMPEPGGHLVRGRGLTRFG